MFLPAATPLTTGAQSVLFAPALANTTGLSDTEKSVMHTLAGKLLDPAYQHDMQLSELYYHGLNIVPSLGISIPPELESLRSILGWCAAGVDARSERLSVQGFRLPGSTEVDTDLQTIWQTNNLDAEAPLAHDAALIFGRCYGIAGPRPDGGTPLITIESPRNMICSVDPRTRDLSAAYQTYRDEDPASETYGRQLATLYTRGATIQLVADPRKGWIVEDRNDHNAGIVPAVQFAPRASLTNRMGRSEMSAAWRNTQDRACRTLGRMEVSGEFFATMKIFVLGATEETFRKPDGTKATAWETFIGRISAIAADANGVLPDVKAVPGQSPDGFTSTLDHERQLMSGHTGLAPQYLGIFSDGNPASADAIRMSDFRLKTIADRLAITFGDTWEALMRIAMTISGKTPADSLEQLETDWAYTGIPTPSADTQSMATQVGAGIVAPTSDDVLAKLGWTPVQRQRLAIERDKWTARAEADELLAGLNNPDLQASTGGGQAADGEQPAALAALDAQRSTDGAAAG